MIVRYTVVAFLLLLALPLTQTVFTVLPETRLYGTTSQSALESLSFDTWFNGHWQRQFNDWFNDRLGLKGYLVKTDNQIKYWLFKESANRSGTKIIFGRNNYLYEKVQIDYYNQFNLVSQEKLNKEAANLRTLQEKLNDRKITFLLLISPSKTSIYPEFIPTRYIAARSGVPPSDYTNLIERLDEYKVNYVDARQYFLEQKYKARYPLFGKSGAHWSQYGACLVAREILDRLAVDSKRKLVRITCEPVTVGYEPRGKDADLLELTNMWTPSVFKGETPYPTISVVADKKTERPNVLFVGDSFVWHLLDIMDVNKIYQRRDFYYYFSRNSTYPNKSFDPIDKNALDWEKDVLSHDIIILEVNETNFSHLGFGFIEELLSQRSRF